MPRILSSRKARFKAALARCGMSQLDFLRKHDISRTHLYLTLENEKQSLKLARAIDEFITHVESQVAA